MKLYQWAIKHHVSPEAMQELMALFTEQPTNSPQSAPEGSEAAVQQLVRLEASRKGYRLYRNNVGAAIDRNGNNVRYGLCNESKRMNDHIKSSDLIGIKPVRIQQEHVGCIIGQFVAREVKRPGWKYAGTAREEAQLRFLQLIAGMGGDACFATGEGTL